MQYNNNVHFDKSGLIEKIGDDDEFIVMLIDTYKKSMLEYIRTIQEAKNIGETEKFKRSAHALKGASYSACMNLMGNIAATIEKTDLNNTETVQKLLDDLDTEKMILLSIFESITNS